jgi:2-methylcitrate dehydratase PrpD
MRPATIELSALIVETPPDALSGQLRGRAETIVIDTFGAILAGAGSEAAGPLLRYANAAGAVGRAPILGTAVETAAEMAAFVNGSFGHALEFDDVFSMMPGHPAAVILAALISDMATRPTSGAELTEAFVIGYETATRMGVAMTLEHHRLRFFHATSTLGIFGAAAALARLRRYGVGETARTL